MNMFMVHRQGFVFRIHGWGLRLILGDHNPLYTERHRYRMWPWHTRWFCLAILLPLSAGQARSVTTAEPPKPKASDQ